MFWDEFPSPNPSKQILVSTDWENQRLTTIINCIHRVANHGKFWNYSPSLICSEIANNFHWFGGNLCSEMSSHVKKGMIRFLSSKSLLSVFGTRLLYILMKQQTDHSPLKSVSWIYLKSGIEKVACDNIDCEDWTMITSKNVVLRR